jgi:hypothetical protein
MFGIFKTAKQKQQEAALNSFTDRIAHACAEVQASIRAIEATPQPRGKLFAARLLRNIVMRNDRSEEAVRKLRNSAQTANGVNSKHPFAIAALLIECGVHLAKLEGEAWSQGAMMFASLEGMICGFLQRQGVEEWEGMYAYDFEFERYRQVWMEQNPVRKSEPEDDGSEMY